MRFSTATRDKFSTNLTVKAKIGCPSTRDRMSTGNRTASSLMPRQPRSGTARFATQVRNVWQYGHHVCARAFVRAFAREYWHQLMFVRARAPRCARNPKP